MKIALFSDIHANLPAFQAFLKDLDSRKPDALYCLGDLVGYNIWPNEVINEIRKRGIATIAGNHDLKVPSSDATGKNFAYSIVSEENQKYLRSLPAHIRLEYKLNDELIRVLLVHGSPRSNEEYLLEDLDENYVRALLFEAAADILICAHSHKPYHRIITAQNDPTFQHIINTGSVGKPKGGDPRGVYVVLTVNEKRSLADRESINIEFIRFNYDIEKAAKAVEDSPLPNEFADRLRKAY
jgi:putative phosphoesterase